jgi:hypothetical protein
MLDNTALKDSLQKKDARKREADTKGLQCRKFECRISFAVAFAPFPAPQQFIMGQSFGGQPGWHLLLLGERLVLQTDGVAEQLDTAFTPNPGQRYKIEIVRSHWRVAISVDSVVLAKGDVVPFTDLVRNLTVGGREGPSRLPLTGAVGDLKIARLRPQE